MTLGSLSTRLVFALCLCTLGTHYCPSFVRLLFVQHLSPSAPNSFGEIFLRFVIMYLYRLRRTLKYNKYFQTRFFGVLWCEDRLTLFWGDSGSYRRWTRRQQQSWKRWQNWFPLSLPCRSPSILAGADQAGCAHLIKRPLTQIPPLLLSLHPIFFSSLILT